jgi:AbrB family looped-hinge helix DNA binding protein
MRITSKGRVTIPAKIRKQAGLLPGTEVDFEFDGITVSIVPIASGKKRGRGARIVAHLRARRGDVTMSTDEIMALTRGE